MLIKFKKPDPRAGIVVQMDSSRGRDLVDAGAADEVNSGAVAEPSVEPVEPVEMPTEAPVRRGKKK